jgi:hypothetical protein
MLGKVPGEHHDNEELGKLRRLELYGAYVYPALGTLGGST